MVSNEGMHRGILHKIIYKKRVKGSADGSTVVRNVDSKTLKRETAPNAKINPLNKVQEEKLPEASFNE